MDDQLLFEQILELKKQGLGYRKIAVQLGTSFNEVYNCYRRHIKSRLPLIELDKEREVRNKRIETVTRRQLISQELYTDDLLSAIRSVVVPVIGRQKLIITKESEISKERSAVLLLSDMHLGQSTESRINGGWQQDSTVARLQFASLRKQLLDAQPTLNAHELVILDLGDDVDNDNMRVSQHRMVDQLVVQQTAEYGRLLAELVQDALSVYPTVRVERVPGNHGRTTQKSSYGGLAELDPIDSFDWLAGEFAREILRGDIAKGLVSLVNHDKWYGITEVQGHRVLFEHGASVKAPYSYLSPLAAVERTAHAYRELFGEFKLYCLGHFHKSYVIPFGYNGLICGNGSFPPTSPFVVTNLHQATEPVQLLLTVTPSAVEEVRRLTLPVQRSAA